MTLSLMVVWLNLGMSLVAASVCRYAARHTFPELRPVFAATTILALIYSGAYVWLAFNLERSGVWSQYVRPVSLVAWPVAWMCPAALSVILWLRINRRFEGEQ